MRGQLWRSFARMWQGFELVAASRYLSHLCLYIVLSTTISSFLFFEKSMVRVLHGALSPSLSTHKHGIF